MDFGKHFWGCFLLVLSFLATSAQAEQLIKAGTIQSFEESVSILRHQSQKKSADKPKFARGKYWQEISPQNEAPVYYGDLIDTKEGGRIYLALAGGMNLIIPPGSLIYLTPSALKRKDNTNIIEILGGMLRGFIKNKALENRYEFRTKSSSAGVRGTDFLIVVDDEKTEITTFEGSVEVRSILTPEAPPVVVAAGQTTTIKTPTPELIELKASDPEQFAAEVAKVQPQTPIPVTATRLEEVAAAIQSPNKEEDQDLVQLIEEKKTEERQAEDDDSEPDDGFDDESFIDHDWLAIELMGGIITGNLYPNLGLGVDFTNFAPTLGFMVFPFRDWPVGFGLSAHGTDIGSGEIAGTNYQYDEGHVGGLLFDIRGTLQVSEGGRVYAEFGPVLGGGVELQGFEVLDPPQGSTASPRQERRDYNFNWSAFHLAAGYSHELAWGLWGQAELGMIAGLLSNTKENNHTNFEFEGDNGKGFMTLEVNFGLFYPLF